MSDNLIIFATVGVVAFIVLKQTGVINYLIPKNNDKYITTKYKDLLETKLTQGPYPPKPYSGIIPGVNSFAE